ncbi:TAXI family TRAP transporter solute-binding subunit [Nakamurella sp. A5-74]|uniref:TAXI family TRAP transporter solute-binding subunit n=1 Tax=Nakamurella sp. A5-74 TaxID=3158264 RepID=A0AAU8DQE2_9ACTN
MGDSFRALGEGLVDVAIATPASFSRLAHQGLGPFAGRAIPQLRAIAVLPHQDAMIAVARADLEFTQLSDAAAHPGSLRISLGTNDPDGFMGFAGDLLLESAGVDLTAIEANGGTVTRHEQPFDAIADLREGRADIMISEAIMTPDWTRLATTTEVTFLPVTVNQQQWLAGNFGLGIVEVPGGYFPGLPNPLPALDYAGWIIATTDALPDADAALLARAVVENSEVLAAQYRHLPADRSPLAYPITVGDARVTPIPLHPAAANIYDRFEQGELPG